MTLTSQSEIETRLEKIRFIAAELHTAMDLAKACHDDFLARTIARHVLVRAKDLIDHTRQIRKPLRLAGHDVTHFHERKETYAQQFEEYFATLRTKVSAHVQDLDFLQRIDLWNEIELSKLAFFVDGAQEICAALPRVSGEVPGVASLSAVELREKTAGIGFPLDSRGVYIGTDPLALTRPNTATILNATSVHQRASQLALLDGWIRDEVRLLRRFQGIVETRRVLVALLLRDVVSFGDCLVTRQHGDLVGLNDLLKDCGDPASIHQFLTRFRFYEQLENLRALRNAIGGHVEIDASVTLSALLDKLDQFDTNLALLFFDKVVACFRESCRVNFFLGSYAMGRDRLSGLAGSRDRGESVVSFGVERSETSADRQRVSRGTYDLEAIDTFLDQWISGENADDVRQEMWSVFSGSPVVEKVTEPLDVETGANRTQPFEYRLAHTRLLEKLVAANEPATIARLLELVEACARGYPRPLLEVVSRYWNTTGCPLAFSTYARVVSELADWEHGVALLLHSSDARCNPEEISLPLALFRIFMREEGMARNNRKEPRDLFSSTIRPLVSQVNARERLIAILAMASDAWWGNWAGDSTKAERDALTSLVSSEISSMISSDDQGSESIDMLLRAGDFVGLALHVGDHLRKNGDPDASSNIHQGAASGLIRAGHFAASAANLAVIQTRVGNSVESLRVAQWVVARNPSEPEYSVLLAQILAHFGRVKEATHVLSTLTSAYVLEPTELDRIATIEDAIRTTCSQQ